MAYSKSFFGLRRGSTKSLTFSKLNGKQVTKDRVSDVANPRTSKQMYQRVIFTTIAKAASVMKPIINHSFEGIKGGDACIKEFRKLNLYKLRNQVAADIAAKLGPDELNAYFAPKGYPFITPNPYIVSKGSLSAPLLQFSAISLNPMLFRIPSDATIRDFIQAYLGMNPGEQLTHLFINAGHKSIYYEVAESPGLQCMMDNVFGARRIVFRSKAETAWDSPAISNGEINLAALKNCIFENKSDMNFFDVVFTLDSVTTSEDVTTIATVNRSILNEWTVASALVRSKQNENNSWLYSNSSMKINLPDDPNFGLPIDEAVKTYTTSANVGKNNNPFLDEGGNGGNNEDFHV